LLKELEGEIGLGFGFNDQILPFKILNKFSKETGTLKILGGLIEKEWIEKERTITLAELPTKEELLARVVRGISAPISGLVNVLEGNLRGLVFVLSAIKK